MIINPSVPFNYVPDADFEKIFADLSSATYHPNSRLPLKSGTTGY